MFGRRKKQIVGCDIGSSAIKVVELKPSKGNEFQLVNAAIGELSSEAIVDGAIMDASLVVETLSRMIADHGIKNPHFGTSVSGHSVILKKIELPAMSEAEIAESIQWEAEQYIPFDINEVNLAYQIIGEGGGDTMDVLLVAVKKDKISDYTSVLIQAGKEPALVDVDAFALQNAYELSYEAEQGSIALVSVGASVMNINVLTNGETVFRRDVAFGGNECTEAIQRQFNLTREDAERFKRGEKVRDQSPQDLVGVARGFSEDLAAELQKTIDFFVATSTVDQVDKIILAGGSAKLLDLDEVLEGQFQVPVEVMNPFRSIRYNESEFDPEWINSHAPAMAIAVGLAIRTVGE